MTIISNLYSGGGQFAILLCVLFLWGGMSVLGSAVGTRNQMAEAAPLYGWAVVSFLFTAFGTLSTVPFTYIAMALLFFALVSVVYVGRRDGRYFASGAGRVVLLAAPLLLVASAMGPSQWDEFSNWLPNVRFLVTTDGFPGGDNNVTGSVFPAYPYGWVFLSYLSSTLAGGFVENAGGVLNVVILLTFGMVVTRVFSMGLGQEGDITRRWGLAALAVLAGFAFNPTFSQKIVFTAYADTSSAVVLAIGGVLGWMMLNALVANDGEKAKSYAIQFGLVLSVLVNLKQVGMVLFILVLGGTMLAGLVDRNIKFRPLIKQIPFMVIPSLVVYVLWRLYVAAEFTGGEFSIREFSTWNIEQIPQILWKMLVVLAKKGAYLVLMTVTLIFSVRGLLRRNDPLDRLSIIAGAVFFGYTAFLFFAYVSSFGPVDAVNVTSYWRYNMHLGPLGIVFGAYGVSLMWKRHMTSRCNGVKLTRFAVALVLVIPVAFSHKLRFDLEAPKPHFINISHILADTLPMAATIAVIDPQGTGESMVITGYALGLKRKMVGFVSAFSASSMEGVRSVLQMNPEFILVHSITPAVQEALSLTLSAHVSYLLSQNNGQWKILRSWPYAKP